MRKYYLEVLLQQQQQQHQIHSIVPDINFLALEMNHAHINVFYDVPKKLSSLKLADKSKIFLLNDSSL